MAEASITQDDAEAIKAAVLAAASTSSLDPEDLASRLIGALATVNAAIPSRSPVDEQKLGANDFQPLTFTPMEFLPEKADLTHRSESETQFEAGVRVGRELALSDERFRLATEIGREAGRFVRTSRRTEPEGSVDPGLSSTPEGPQAPAAARSGVPPTAGV